MPFDTIWPARVSSRKPMIEARAVFFTSWTMKPTVGGMAARTAWGAITSASGFARVTT